MELILLSLILYLVQSLLVPAVLPQNAPLELERVCFARTSLQSLLGLLNLLFTFFSEIVGIQIFSLWISSWRRNWNVFILVNYLLELGLFKPFSQHSQSVENFLETLRSVYLSWTLNSRFKTQKVAQLFCFRLSFFFRNFFKRYLLKGFRLFDLICTFAIRKEN